MRSTSRSSTSTPKSASRAIAASDYPRLIERIRARKPDGCTALYDALGVYLNGAGMQDGQKILIMYTDGGDTRSSLTHSDVLDLLRASDVTVYVIGYLEHQSQSSRTSQRLQLERFATMTGGQALFPTSLKEVEKMYEKIQREIAARYSLGYLSTDLRDRRRLARGRHPAEAPRPQGRQAPHPRRLFRAPQGELAG